MRYTHLDAHEENSEPSGMPSYKGEKHKVSLTQVMTLLQGSKNAVSLEQMLVTLMSKGVHQNADTVGMTMAQKSIKASIKRWGADAELIITNKMKQLHWQDSYNAKHWHELSKKQKEQVLESHIFVEQKRDGKIKACKVIGGNKQRDYITKEDMSSPRV